MIKYVTLYILIKKYIFMKILNATEAKREFGDLLIQVQTEPISISKNGKSIAVMISDREFHELETCKEQLLKLAIDEGLADIKQGKIHTHQEVFQRLENIINDKIQ